MSAKSSPAKQANLEVLKPYRARIDALDDKIVDLMIERFDVIREVAEVKIKAGIPAILEDRIREVVDRAGDRAGASNPDNEDMIREIYIMMVAVCCDLEEQIIEDLPPMREREAQFDDDEDDDDDE